jgi:signal transduction histidine kinase
MAEVIGRDLAEQRDHISATLEIRGRWSGLAFRGAVQTIIVNLLENAIRHCGRDKPTIVISIDPKFGEKRLPISVTLEVADNGCGVPPHLVPHIFRSGVSSSESSGLGLAISKYLAERVGGSLELTSNGPDGATFTFAMPIKDLTADD